MGTRRFWFGLTNTTWKSLEVISVKWDSYDYQDLTPKTIEGWKIAEGETKKLALEVYNGANGARFMLTLKVDGDWTFTVTTDPREQADSKVTTHSLIPTEGTHKDPPVVYLNQRPEWGDGGGIEYVAGAQAEGLLANNGDLDAKKNAAWAATIRKDYYSHKFVNDVIPVAVNPVDDRAEGGSSSYNVRRNANWMFGKFLLDIVAWGADPAGLSSNFFKNLPAPVGATPDLYQTDGMLSSFLLFGPDPMTIELVTDEAKLPAALSRDKRTQLERDGRLPAGFEEALAEGRVFHVDFSRYSHVASPGRFASWPHAVFFSKPTTDSFGNRAYNLMPVAMALNPPGRPRTDVVTVFAHGNDDASSHCSWETAKRVFLSAAANYHELGTHLGRTHLVMERYALATYRHLPPWHPVGRLLRPHLKFMVATNNEAFRELVNPDGPVDVNFMASIDQLMHVSVDAFNTWDLKTHGGIEADLARRGLLGKDVKLPGWPYKVDGLFVYRCIRNFVSSYLQLWYASSGGAYREDIALRNWRGALRTEYRAGALMAADASLDDLVTACTNIIWTCGPQHSAVNYSQYDYLADAKTLPFSIQPNPSSKPFDPSRSQIGDQAKVIARLSLYRYDQLGVYSTESFLTEYGDLGDPRAPWKVAIDRFQNELKPLNWRADAPPSLWSYPFLAPALITNGISI